MLFPEIQRQKARGKMPVALEAATLGAVGDETGHVDAHRHAGVAVLAVRPIGELTAAAEAGTDQRTVGVAVDQVGGRGDLRTGAPTLQIAAVVMRGQIELDALEGRFSRVHRNATDQKDGASLPTRTAVL